MFTKKELEILALHWAYEFSIAKRSGGDMQYMWTAYERFKDLLGRHNAAFRESLFDKASEFYTYYNADGTPKP